jgi:ethanolamine utilization protein EutP (predicted NTPase)
VFKIMDTLDYDTAGEYSFDREVAEALYALKLEIDVLFQYVAQLNKMGNMSFIPLPKGQSVEDVIRKLDQPEPKPLTPEHPSSRPASYL